MINFGINASFSPGGRNWRNGFKGIILSPISVEELKNPSFCSSLSLKTDHSVIIIMEINENNQGYKASNDSNGSCYFTHFPKLSLPSFWET